MVNTMAGGLAQWHKFVSEKDTQVLAEVLAENVLLHSPVLWKPKAGKEIAILYLSSAIRILEDFTYDQQFFGDDAVVLIFSAHIDKWYMKGVDILRFNTEGQISDLEVMVRPASALQIFGAAMAQQLAGNLPPAAEN